MRQGDNDQSSRVRSGVSQRFEVERAGWVRSQAGVRPGVSGQEGGWRGRARWREAMMPWARRHSRLDGFSHRANLVDFQQQAIASLLLHRLGNPLGVGDCEVIPHNLDVDPREERGPGGPVILVKRILNGHHWWRRQMSPSTKISICISAGKVTECCLSPCIILQPRPTKRQRTKKTID